MDYKLISERIPNTTLLEQILYNRGFTSKEDIWHYLNVDEKDNLDPNLLENMQAGVELLAKHIKNNDKAVIIYDSDTDGYTSSALFLNYFNNFFPAWVQNNITYLTHSGKQHGLNDQPLEDFYKDGIKLVICPDSSSSDYSEHKWLAEHGIDCLVLDHHLADNGYSKYAVTINNQLCDYPTKSLSGVAIAYKFCYYFDKLMGTNYALEYLDLVALGLIADMMTLTDFETHYLIKEGLQRVQNPFFAEMVKRQKYKLENNMTPIGIAFYVVPYINAMTRSGEDNEKLLIFEAMLEWRANEMIPSTKRGFKGTYETRVEQAGRTCMNVKSRQKKNQDFSLENIETMIEEHHLLDNKILVVPTEQEDVDRNLAGLIANQLANKYVRPTLVLRRIEHPQTPLLDSYVTYEGSGRNFSKSQLEDLRQFCLDTGLVEYAQGHQQAFGCGIKEENLQKFIDVTNELLKDFDTSPCYSVDLEVSEEELSDIEVFSIASNGDLWGQGVPEPLIAITDIVIDKENIRFMGDKGNTLRITLPNRKTSIIKFNLTDEEKERLNPDEGTLVLTVVGKCALNHYMGNVTPQIMLEDFEIKKQMKWSF